MKLSWAWVAAMGGVAVIVSAGACATGGLAGMDAGGGPDAGGADVPSGCPQYDLMTDPKHCGSCTNACQSTQVCSSGQCKAQCGPPTTKCLNVDAGAGLCIDLSTDVGHCGQCTNACALGDAGGPMSGSEDNPDAGIPTPDGGFPPGPYWSSGSPTCDGGMCGIACPPPMTMCGDMICYDTQNAHGHCGSCTNACADDTLWCTHGNCCPVGQAYCSGACTDILSDNSNCGGCGITCSGGTPDCSNGVCASAITYTDAFTTNVIATSQCTDWKTVLGKLTGTYSSVTIKGTFDSTGRTCSGSNANTICQALHNGTSVSGLSCGGYTWEVYEGCGSSTPELSADGTTCACPSTGYDVRPCITTDANWGGVGTATCGAPSQTMTVICQ